MTTPVRGRPPLASPLYVICDEEVCARAGWQLPDYASACLDGGARLLQLRLKKASSRRFFDVTRAVVARARSYEAQVVVNDRADIARLGGASGVHVGQEDLRPSDVVQILGDHAILGLSTHALDQVHEGIAQPVSYLATGPVFGTTTKNTGYHAVGLESVRSTASIAHPLGIEVVAIGGITLERATSVIEAGADALAVISDLLITGHPADRVREFLAELPNRSADGDSFRRPHQERT